MADLTLKTITKGMEDGPEDIQANFQALADEHKEQIALAADITALNGYKISDGYIRRVGNRVTGSFSVTNTGGTTALRYKDILTLPTWATPKSTAFATMTWDNNHILSPFNLLIKPTGTIYAGGIGDNATVVQGSGWFDFDYFVD
ncbi:hypothetical protein [Lacticaseibacillus hulanensis]|uniref:hypothetical protein n=1 Tax=Lacticaseibacillus hulanensis TaxID=2493111 RepID=UPI000FD8D2F4|nr:hypothetical protein [Lacticaseibacillus hulanensis]